VAWAEPDRLRCAVHEREARLGAADSLDLFPGLPASPDADHQGRLF